MNTTFPNSHYRIENESVVLELDCGGCLRHFANRKTGTDYAGGRALWRLFLQQGQELDIELSPGEEAKPVIRQEGPRLSLRYDTLMCRGSNVAVTVEISVSLCEDEVHWLARLENNEPGLVLREFHFPLIGNVALRENQKLIWSKNGGEKIPSLRDELRHRYSEYKGPDHRYLGMVLNYPFSAATNCFVLADDAEGLYFGCHCHDGHRMLHQFRLYPDAGMEAGMVRFPGVACGEAANVGPFVLSPYCGTWHVAARKYRKWADEWFRPVTPPLWVRRTNGWQRIILQHQYGEIHYDYARLPEIHADGDRSGIDTLFMFGWHRGGHDNNYPDYEPEPRLGSAEALQQGIEYFNRKGGHVILYANGRLMDRTSEYYQKIGHRFALHDFFGNEIFETYRFKGTGEFVSQFANRTLVAVCPTCDEWFEVLRDLADRALRWKCHSLFLDQAGTTEYPCCNPEHSHPPLKMDQAWDKAAMLRKLHSYLRERDSEMALGIELLTDITAQHADYIHNIAGGCDARPAIRADGTKGESRAFIDWFRYVFPEIIISNREIRDDTDIERRVNHAVLLGLRMDVEIYRCRRTLAETPHYASYLAQINALRQQYADVLLEGRYADTEGVRWDNSEVDARVFLNVTRAAVVLTQSHLDSCVTRVALPGARRIEERAIGQAKVTSQGTEAEVTLARHALVVLIYEREPGGEG